MTMIHSAVVRTAEIRLRLCGEDSRIFPYPQALDDRRKLADAFLLYFDETPLTLTLKALKKFGFKRCRDTEGRKRLYGLKVTINGKHWWLKCEPKSFWFYGVNPQPRTVGDLLRLLYQFQRDAGKE